MKSIPIRHIHNHLKELGLSGRFSIRSVKDMLKGEDMVQELHRHGFYYLLALKKGRGSHEIDFSPYEVGDHTVFFLRPGQVHQLILKVGCTGYLMQFGTDFYPHEKKASKQRLYKIGTKNLYPLDALKSEKLFSTLAAIFQEYTDKQEGHTEAIKANLEILFIELARQHSTPVPNNPAGLYAQERLDEFLKLLETHISEYKQVSQYADMLNLSPYQLNTITKEMLGKTCSILIREHIILEAKRLLLATPEQVNQIAHHLGYEDVSYFIRFFKRHTGHPPEIFRLNFTEVL